MEVVVLKAWVIETNDGVRVKDLDDLGEVGERTGQAVDLVDDHDVDLPGDDVGEQALQRRPLRVSPREPGIVIELRQRLPALVLWLRT
jgi:hypothetical protein